MVPGVAGDAPDGPITVIRVNNTSFSAIRDESAPTESDATNLVFNLRWEKEKSHVKYLSIELY